MKFLIAIYKLAFSKDEVLGNASLFLSYDLTQMALCLCVYIQNIPSSKRNAKISYLVTFKVIEIKYAAFKK